MRCLICGKECQEWLCEEHKNNIDYKELLTKMADFRVEDSENELWVQIAKENNIEKNFFEVMNEVVKDVPSPYKEFYLMYAKGKRLNRAFYLNKLDRYLAENYEEIMMLDDISEEDKDIIKAIAFSTNYNNKQYEKAEELSSSLLESATLTNELRLNLIEYYGQTRRFETARKLYEERTIDECEIGFEKLKRSLDGWEHKKFYLPSSSEDKQKFADFMNSIGFDVEYVICPKKIPEDEFKRIESYFGSPLTSYTAFCCLEAFGMSKAKSIYEIAAVKIKNNKVEKEWSTYVRPQDSGKELRRVTAKAAGIDQSILDNGPRVWAAIAEFLEIVSDDVVIALDGSKQKKLLTRALRYSSIDHLNNKFININEMCEDLQMDECQMPKGLEENADTESLLKAFNLSAGKSAIDGARNAMKVYEELKGIQK